MSWFRSLFRKEAQMDIKTPEDIVPGTKFRTVIKILGEPCDDLLTGADVLGHGSPERPLSDTFLYFDKDPNHDYSVRFSQGKVISVREYPKRRPARS